MEQLCPTPQCHDEPDNFSLRNWAMKATISRDNTKSRRYSASNIRSFREESFRSTTTISSTVSSPGYTFGDTDEIDPSTYSFTTALKALQARSGYGWEWLSPDTGSLSSKWNEAEKYICNPLSGEFPIECLSTKTLSGRHFGNIKFKTTMSAPLIYSSRPPMIQTRPPTKKQDHELPSPSEVEEIMVEVLTRDVATQSTPPDVSSSSPSPASTPLRENCESPKACPISKFEIEIDMTNEVAELKKKEQKKDKRMNKCSQGICFPWKSLLMRKAQRRNQKQLWQNLFTKRNIYIER